MIRTLSSALARSVSARVAVSPPASASAPGTPAMASRMRSTVAVAASESGASASVAWMSDRPFFETGRRDGADAVDALDRGCDLARGLASFARTRTGDPAPAGKCFAAISSPTTEGGVVK